MSKAISTHHAMHAVAKPTSGKGSARELRRQGYTPAVIYGLAQAPQHLAVKTADLTKALRVGHFFTHVQEVKLGNDTFKLLARDIQRDAVTDLPLHIDFLRFNPDSQVHVNVMVVITGQTESPGLKTGGVLQVVETSLELVCRADSIPQEIIVSVADLEIGGSVHLSSIQLPAGTRSAVTERDLTIASVIATRTSTMNELAAVPGAAAAPATAAVPAANQKNPPAAPAAGANTKGPAKDGAKKK